MRGDSFTCQELCNRLHEYFGPGGEGGSWGSWISFKKCCFVVDLVFIGAAADDEASTFRTSAPCLLLVIACGCP